MAQLHFSVDRETAERLSREAKDRGMSLSQYLASIVQRELPRAWPEGYLEQVVGSSAGSGLEVPADPAPDDVSL